MEGSNLAKFPLPSFNCWYLKIIKIFSGTKNMSNLIGCSISFILVRKAPATPMCHLRPLDAVLSSTLSTTQEWAGCFWWATPSMLINRPGTNLNSFCYLRRQLYGPEWLKITPWTLNNVCRLPSLLKINCLTKWPKILKKSHQHFLSVVPRWPAP